MKILFAVTSTIRSHLARMWLSMAALCILASPNTAIALTFEFINSQVMRLTENEMSAVERAGKLWSDQFTDPVTIKINVEWQDETFFASDNILASVQIGRTTAPMRMVRDILLAETSDSEYSVLSALPEELRVSHDITNTLANKISLTLANAKALGITPANDPHFGDVLQHNADAHISFNKRHRHRFFYDQDYIDEDKYDLTGIVAHEIGHALGFTSIVDIQAVNSGVLNPMLLDVFRFPKMPLNPSLANDKRQTSPAHAQFSDDILKNVSFGSGYDIFDSNCRLLPDRRCSASHWADITGNLMTSAGKGKRITLKSDDIHAIDRLGVDTQWRSGIPLINVKAEFYSVRLPLPDYDERKFRTKIKAPPFDEVKPWFETPTTHAFHISFDGHAGAGYAVFVPKTENTQTRTLDLNPRVLPRGQWETESKVTGMAYFPPHFTHFYFKSQSRNNRYRFNFISTFSDYGAIFDPELGAYGGFRISGFLDGELDGTFPEPSDPNSCRDDDCIDYDASITMLLLLQEPRDINDGIAGASFTIEWPGKPIIQDNIIHLIDSKAFGAPPGYNNSESYKCALKNRVTQLDGDIEPAHDIAL